MIEDSNKEICLILISRDLSSQDLLRRYRVFIDGNRVGYIRPGEDFAFAVAEGRHTVQMKIDWGGSPKQECALEKGYQAVFQVSGKSRWTAPFRMISRTRWIVLELVKEGEDELEILMREEEEILFARLFDRKRSGKCWSSRPRSCCVVF